MSEFTIVVATFNAGRTLQACLDAIAAQETAAQLIVMDGGSTDDSVAIIERNAERIDHWESEPDRGVYHAWNKALDHAGGDWLCFLGADDRFAAPDVLSRVRAQLAQAPDGTHIAYASMHVVDSTGRVVSVVGGPWEVARAGIRERMTLPNPATFYRRSLFARHGRFDERFRIAGDYEFALRELLQHDAMFMPGLVAVLMDEGGLSSDPRLRPVRLREIAEARHRHGVTRVPAWAAPVVLKAQARAALESALGPERAARLRGAYRAITRRPSD